KSEPRSPVDLHRFVQIVREGAERLSKKKYSKAHRERRHGKPLKGIEPTEIPDGLKVDDDRRLPRDHQGPVHSSELHYSTAEWYVRVLASGHAARNRKGN